MGIMLQKISQRITHARLFDRNLDCRMASANIAFLEKGPWYLMNDPASMRALLGYASAIVSSLDLKEMGIHGNCAEDGNAAPFALKQALLVKKIQELPNEMWQLQFMTFCSLFLLDSLIDKVKQNAPESVCRHFFDSFQDVFAIKVFGESEKASGYFASTPLEITTTLMISLETAYNIAQ